MTVDIIVLRGAGDLPGEDIIDPLLTVEYVAVERGRNALDDTAVLQQTVQETIIYRPGLALGQIVEVVDALQGAVWRGKIVGLSYRGTGAPDPRVECVVDITRPAGF